MKLKHKHPLPLLFGQSRQCINDYEQHNCMGIIFISNFHPRKHVAAKSVWETFKQQGTRCVIAFRGSLSCSQHLRSGFEQRPSEHGGALGGKVNNTWHDQHNWANRRKVLTKQTPREKWASSTFYKEQLEIKAKVNRQAQEMWFPCWDVKSIQVTDFTSLGSGSVSNSTREQGLVGCIAVCSCR
jgi:hypothetical protein